MLLQYLILIFLIIKCSTQSNTKGSLAFVIDNTNSMKKEIDDVLNSVDVIFDTVTNHGQSQIENYILVTFNDYDPEAPIDKRIKDLSDTQFVSITKDRDDFKAALRSVEVSGGKDCPEYALSGIKLGLEVSLPYSIIFVVTDASAKDRILYESVKSLAVNKQSQIFFILTGECLDEYKSVEEFNNLANVTKGNVFYLEKYQIGKIVKYLEHLLTERGTTILDKALPAGKNNVDVHLDIHVVDTTAIVTSTGNVTKLNVTAPDENTEIQVKTISEADKFKIINFKPTKPGNYVISIESEDDSRLLIRAKSKVLFQHGFSPIKPNSLDETTIKPVPGVHSYVAIELTKGDILLVAIQITKLNNDPLYFTALDNTSVMETPLVLLKDNFYITEPIMPPNSIFQIAVIGHDPDSKTNITRYSQPIEAQQIDLEAISKMSPSLPSVTIKGDETVNVPFGDTLQLFCQVSGYPKPDIVWKNTHNGEPLPSQVLTYKLPKDFISILTLDNVKDNMTLECKANNTKVIKAKNVTVLTKEPEHYFKELQTIKETNIEYLKEGKMNCEVDAYPPVIITWLRNNKKLLTNENITINNTINNSTITIKNTTVSDKGNYTCIARNSVAEKSVIVTVNITGLDAPKINKNDKLYTVNVSSSAKIMCNILQGTPIPTVNWSFKSTKSDKYVLIPLWNGNSTINIDNVGVNNAGSYKCKVSNEVGSDNHDVDLIVQYPPKIDKNVTESIESKVGSSVEMTCNVIQGKPKASIKWYKSTKPGTYEPIPKWNNNTTIKLENVKESDAGSYKCEATNLVGSDHNDIELIVQYAPRIEIDEEIIKVNVGDELSINCDIKGIPIPKISWFKNDQPLSYDSTTHKEQLFIKENVQLTDRGDYKCKAKNIIGTAFKIIRVEVFVPVHITPPENNTISVMVGSLVPLPCKATGDPIPKIEWKYRSGFQDFIVINGTLSVNNIQVDDEGEYMCVATNSEGSTYNISYYVQVLAKPEIENLNKTIKAVEGDLNLRITCKAFGNPKPNITWTNQNGLNLALGIDFFVQRDNLVIKNVTKASEGIYKCEAKNIVGTATNAFKVSVDLNPEVRNPEPILIKLGITANISCPLEHTLIDQLRWYKNGVASYIKIGELSIKNPTVKDEGIYTCRVSNIHGSHSSSVKISVVHGPKFEFEPNLEIEFYKGYTHDLNCEAFSIPKPETTWYHGNVKLNTTDPVHDVVEMTLTDIGTYTCQVKNDFGNITRTFNIVTKDCYIKPDIFPQILPSVLNGPIFNTVNKQIVIPNNEKFVLYCPSQFINFPTVNNLQVFCKGDNNQFYVNGAMYDYSDLQCNRKVEPKILGNGEKCLGANTEMIKIENEVYEVCFDYTKNIPLYAVHNMSKSLASDDIETNWSNTNMLRIDFDDAYSRSCRRQMNAGSASLGKPFYQSNNCCFSRRQLVNPRDVLKGVPQTATYSYLNVVPHWSTCHMENWNDLEQRVRSFIKEILPENDDLIVWTGVHFGENTRLNIKTTYIEDGGGNSQQVPLYLWKVIQDPDRKRVRVPASLAVVQVNIPDLSSADVGKYLLCKDICSKVDWMNGTDQWRDVNRGYIFCCTIRTFKSSFGFKNVFENSERVVLQKFRLVTSTKV